MSIVATFRTLDENENDVEIGRVTWDGRKAVADPANCHYLESVAKSVNAYHDPVDAMRQLPQYCNSIYLRASIEEK